MDIQFLVERLEALVVNARKVPMTSQIILEQATVLDLIDQLRVAIPEEVRAARTLGTIKGERTRAQLIPARSTRAGRYRCSPPFHSRRAISVRALRC